MSGDRVSGKRLPPPRDTYYYELLGISHTASDDDIRRAYRQKSLICHPDKNLDSKAEAEEMFKLIGRAYEVLKDRKWCVWGVWDLITHVGARENLSSRDGGGCVSD